MSNINQTGISFPFRIGVTGGVVMSSTDVDDATHIDESIIQILGTNFGERVMETHVYSDLDSFVFSNINDSSKTLLKYQIIEALRLDNRVKATEEDITFEETETSLTAILTYTVLSTGYQSEVRIQL